MRLTVLLSGAHSGTTKAHSRATKVHSRTMLSHSVSMQTHSGAMETHVGAVGLILDLQGLVLYTVIKVGRFSEIYLGMPLPCRYIGGKVPKLIVPDVFWNIPRHYCKKKLIIVGAKYLRPPE
jgi:hypothetical protein